MYAAKMAYEVNSLIEAWLLVLLRNFFLLGLSMAAVGLYAPMTSQTLKPSTNDLPHQKGSQQVG